MEKKRYQILIQMILFYSILTPEYKTVLTTRLSINVLLFPLVHNINTLETYKIV